MEIEIRECGITELDTDAIVNAANAQLLEGGGVCGAIFRAAGSSQMQAACARIGHCDTGSAVITPGFGLRAKYVIHAVGPVWRGGKQGEPELLCSAYRSALKLAEENGCRSVGFPLISAGIYGVPAGTAWSGAVRACRDHLAEHPDSLRIVFAVPDPKLAAIGRETLARESAAADGDLLSVYGRRVPAVYFHEPDGPYGWLSNWAPAPFTLDGIRFSSSEQYLMYRKCMLFSDRESAEAVLATDDPERQQKIGRQAAGYVEAVWAGTRQAAAYRALEAKFSQDPELKRKLLDTGDAVLVECARTDPVWACGIRMDDSRRENLSEWKGKNLLGFTLMEVRKVLRGREASGEGKDGGRKEP